jgi:hypothetical protein
LEGWWAATKAAPGGRWLVVAGRRARVERGERVGSRGAETLRNAEVVDWYVKAGKLHVWREQGGNWLSWVCG